ncbi:hypothetical protein CAMRE0001_0422 [Campylobacter rectus RM3267]|uniref:Uncharacterized protein n=2 Tax=Campylobacter rectus TaxID=203 RepID=A0A6G5QJP1_CAMRE|nr:hypothetical protein CAMRE0001_0422 [Campylobacter rectus RM3267]QCD45915.1 hypothetical protein CRECT_0215 [Campylobacter rectus]
MADGAIALDYEFKRREVLALNLGKSGKTETNFTAIRVEFAPLLLKFTMPAKMSNLNKICAF